MDTEWAMDQLRLFIESTTYTPSTRPGGTDFVTPEDQIVAQEPIIEKIFDRTVPDWKARVSTTVTSHRWQVERDIAQRALAQLQREEEMADKLGEAAPELSAARMHLWAWEGARSLWSSGHYREAVSAAAVKIDAETQNKLNRRDLSEVKLFQEAFSLKSPEVGKPRLRLMPDDGSDTFRSMHEGALAFATGCYKAIRNPASHVPLPELPEDEALEQLAAFSVLARWVDMADLHEL